MTARVAIVRRAVEPERDANKYENQMESNGSE